jgi:hypothetical protein
MKAGKKDINHVTAIIDNKFKSFSESGEVTTQYNDNSIIGLSVNIIRSSFKRFTCMSGCLWLGSGPSFGRRSDPRVQNRL